MLYQVNQLIDIFIALADQYSKAEFLLQEAEKPKAFFYIPELSLIYLFGYLYVQIFYYKNPALKKNISSSRVNILFATRSHAVKRVDQASIHIQ